MRIRQNRWTGRAARASRVLLTVALLNGLTPGSVSAHEGHADLPSTGATVDGDQLLISEEARKGIGLETATVTLHDLSRELRVRASVKLPWNGQARVTALVPGRVQRILVKPGETIRAGQELARIESLEVESLQLEMLQAAGETALAERIVAQRRPLAERGAIPGQELLEAETQLRRKQVELAIARWKLRALGLSGQTLQRARETGEPISSISVTSPIDGVVKHADLRVGQSVDTEQHLFDIVDRSQVLLVGEVLETDAWQVHPGQPVEVTLASLPDVTLTGRIDRLRLQISPGERTLGVVARVENRDGRLRPGMSGRMTIGVHAAEQAIVCPTDALIDTPEGTFVLLRQGEGQYERREVEIGLRTPDRVEILDGLFPGDRVIVTGTKLLASLFSVNNGSRGPQKDSRGRSGSGAAPRDSGSSAEAVPVAQGVVQLPTRRKTYATPAIEGRVAAIHVEPGEAVQAGQVLAELDSQQLRSLQLELLETREQLQRVRTTLERVQPLAESGTYPKTRLWQHEQEETTLQQKLESVVRKLSIIGLSAETIERLRETGLDQSDEKNDFATVPVRAPAAGRVADFDVVLGQIVHSDDALFEIHDRSSVWIEGYVFEEHASRVKVGRTARLSFPAYPELRLSGEVVRVAPTLRSSVRVLPVWIRVENPGLKLRDGMFARVEILPQTGSRPVAGTGGGRGRSAADPPAARIPEAPSGRPRPPAVAARPADDE